MKNGYGLGQVRQPPASAGHDQWENLTRVHAERNSLSERLHRFDESLVGVWLRRAAWLLLATAVLVAVFILPLP